MHGMFVRNLELDIKNLHEQIKVIIFLTISFVYSILYNIHFCCLLGVDLSNLETRTYLNVPSMVDMRGGGDQDKSPKFRNDLFVILLFR